MKISNMMRIIAFVTVAVFTWVDIVPAELLTAPVSSQTLASAQGPLSTKQLEAKVHTIVNKALFAQIFRMVTPNFSKDNTFKIVPAKIGLNNDITDGSKPGANSLFAGWWKRYVLVVLFALTVVFSSFGQEDSWARKSDDSLRKKFRVEITENPQINEDVRIKILGGGFMTMVNGKRVIGKNIEEGRARRIEALINDYLPESEAELIQGARAGFFDIAVSSNRQTGSYDRVFKTFSEYGYLSEENLWHTMWKETGGTPAFSCTGAGGLGQLMPDAIKTLAEKWANIDNMKEGIKKNDELLVKEYAKLDTLKSDNASRDKIKRQEKDISILIAKIAKDKAEFRIMNLLNYNLLPDHKRPEVYSDSIEIDKTLVTDAFFTKLTNGAYDAALQDLMNTTQARGTRLVSQGHLDNVMNMAMYAADKNLRYLELAYRKKLAYIAPDHPKAIDKNTCITIALDVSYNWGLMREIGNIQRKGWEGVIKEDLPSETRRYSYEVWHEYIVPFALATKQYFNIHPDEAINEKLTYYTIIQYHLDQADNHTRSIAGYSSRSKEYNQVVDFLKEFKDYDRVIRFSGSNNNLVKLRKSQHRNRDLDNMSYGDILAKVKSFYAKDSQHTNGFLKDLMHDLEEFEMIKSSYPSVYEGEPSLQFQESLDNVVSRGGKIPWGWIGIGATAFLLAGGAYVFGRRRDEEDETESKEQKVVTKSSARAQKKTETVTVKMRPGKKVVREQPEEKVVSKEAKQVKDLLDDTYPAELWSKEYPSFTASLSRGRRNRWRMFALDFGSSFGSKTKAFLAGVFLLCIVASGKLFFGRASIKMEHKKWEEGEVSLYVYFKRTRIIWASIYLVSTGIAAGVLALLQQPMYGAYVLAGAVAVRFRKYLGRAGMYALKMLGRFVVYVSKAMSRGIVSMFKRDKARSSVAGVFLADAFMAALMGQPVAAYFVAILSITGIVYLGFLVEQIDKQRALALQANDTSLTASSVVHKATIDVQDSGIQVTVAPKQDVIFEKSSLDILYLTENIAIVAPQIMEVISLGDSRKKNLITHLNQDIMFDVVHLSAA